jgi:hypothetical protein
VTSETEVTQERSISRSTATRRAPAVARAGTPPAAALAGVAALLLALLAPLAARATEAGDLCSGNPCQITTSKVIGAASVLDFGPDTDVVVAAGVTLTIADDGVGGEVVLYARSIVLEPGAKIVGVGDEASVTLETEANVELRGSGSGAAKIDLRGIEGGLVAISAAGNAVVGAIDVSGSGEDATGGSIGVDAGGTIAVGGDLSAGAAGLGSGGGEITLNAGGAVSVGGILDVSSASDAGTIDITSAIGSISTTKRLAATGGDPDGYGGTITIEADYGDVTIGGPVFALGGTGIEEQCGDGGQLLVDSGLSVTFAADVTLDGGTHCYGGTIEIAANAGFTQAGASVISLGAPGIYGAGGSFFVDAVGNVALRNIDLSSPGAGGALDVSSRSGQVAVLAPINARGTSVDSFPGSIDVEACDVQVTGSLDARGTLALQNAGYVALRASNAMSVSGTVRAATENRFIMRAGQPTLGGTITPAPTVLVDPSLPACEPAAVCGNGVVEAGELCDEGTARNGTQAACCATDCTSAKANGAACDDGAFCNGADTCNFAKCVRHAGSPCTGVSGPCASGTCSESLHCFKEAETACDDADDNSCTDGQCDTSGTCAPTPNFASCDDADGNPCTDGQCDASGACAPAPNFASCDDADGNPCTDGQCDASGACAPTPTQASCDDGTFCNGAETCSDGTCLRLQRACPAASCDEQASACDAFCGDGLAQEGEVCGEPGTPGCAPGEICRDCACETGGIQGDAYLCYAAEPSSVPSWQFEPAASEVRDRFETKVYDVSSIAMVCSAALIGSPQGVFPAGNRAVAQVDHRIALSATPAGQQPSAAGAHAYTDRFGTVHLDMKQPTGLLLRAKLADFGPIETCEGDETCSDERTCQAGFCLPDPASAPEQPPKAKVPVANFKCYAARQPVGSPKFRRVKGLWVDDQLGAPVLYDAVKPVRVCSPASVEGANRAMAAKVEQLTCYKVKRSRSVPKQAPAAPRTVGARYKGFDPAFLDLAGAKELCVPSLVDTAP